MPTSSAATLDRLLIPRGSKSLEVPTTKPLPSKPPISNPKGEQLEEKTFTRLQMSPSLYAIPKEIPLPHSPTSFPPSPYIVNHKGRGLWKRSSSEVHVAKSLKEENSCGNADVQATTTTSLKKSSSLPFPVAEDHPNAVHTEGGPDRPVWDCSPPSRKFWNEKLGNEISNGGIGSNISADSLEWESYLLEPVRIKANKELVPEDFCNPVKSVSYTSGRAESSHKFSSSTGEFYDAQDVLSTDSGSQSSVNNIETELRGMRLSLLMEIERRRQAEETLEKMYVHWRRVREQLAEAGVFVPLYPTSSQYSLNIGDELRCQLEVARFVSDSLANSLAKAEVEMEMELKLEAKNFEITRLSDRLRHYETLNQEMSQRNQAAIELARREAERRKRRHRWIWGSIAATITLGGAVLAWPYLPSGILSTDISQSQPSPIDEAPSEYIEI